MADDGSPAPDPDFCVELFAQLKVATEAYSAHVARQAELIRHVIYARRRLELTAEMIQLEGGDAPLPPLPEFLRRAMRRNR